MRTVIQSVLGMMDACMAELMKQLECAESRLGDPVEVDQSESTIKADVVSWEALFFKHLCKNKQVVSGET
jgi:hypothetical protein